MFEVELLGSLNRYKKSTNKEEQEKLKLAIELLVNENQEELEHFLNSHEIDDETKSFLKSLIKEKVNTTSNNDSNINSNEEEKKEILQSNETKPNIDNKDVQIVLDFYKRWLDAYRRNTIDVDPICTKIIKDILNYYIVDRFEVLEQILAMNDTQEFEKFKIHLKNHIRAYYGEKINEYLDGKYQDLNFFQKFKKDRELKFLAREIGGYKFDRKHISEVLE